ncbi:MAG: hypothetical protein JWO77_2362 [Ilumatobacteraceae bacterium]|nr:hypothetical protein [Ilumatobacteraceae bacterium]
MTPDPPSKPKPPSKTQPKASPKARPTSRQPARPQPKPPTSKPRPTSKQQPKQQAKPKEAGARTARSSGSTRSTPSTRPGRPARRPRPTGLAAVGPWLRRLGRPRRRSDEPAPPIHDKQRDRALVVVAALIPIAVGAAAAISGWRATGDNALIGLRVSDLLRGHLLTSGLPTTGENFGTGITSNHPGPLGFYLLAPFRLVYGVNAGLALGAAAINAAAWGIGVWVMTRRHGQIAGVLTLGIFGVLAYGLGAHILYDPISSNIAAFASVTLVIVTAAVIGGDWKLLPVFVVVASYVIQAHLTYVALGVPLVLVVAVALVVALAKKQPVPLRSLLISLGVGLVLWAPVFWDQFFGTGNISSIIRTFTSEDAGGKGFGFAFGRLVHSVSPVPMFARPTGPIGNLGFLEAAGGVRTAIGVVLLLAFAAAVWHLWRTRSAYRPLAGLVVLVVLASVYSASQLPDPATVKAANLRWMWTGGALVWLVLLVVAADLATRWWRAADLLAVAACLAVLGVLAGATSYWTVEVRDEPAFRAVDTLVSQVNEKLEPGTFIVKYQGEDALLNVGPPLVTDLIDDGFDARVSLGPFDRAYGDHIVTKRLPQNTPALFIATGAEGSDALKDIEASRATDEVIAETRFDPLTGGPPVIVRVYLAKVEVACERLTGLAKELADPNGERPGAEVLEDMNTLASARLTTIAPTLTPEELASIQQLLAQIPAMQQQFTENPELTLQELQVENLQSAIDGIQVLVDLCS